jgi:hypothetical protein
MKKIYLLLAGSALAMAASAQVVQSQKAPVKYKANDEIIVSPVVSENRRAADQPALYKTGTTTVIGRTYFPTQTNGAIYRRTQLLPGGKVSATWTFSSDGPSASYFNRGSGYNHKGDNGWGSIPASRIEPDYRTGYPCIALTPDNKEIVFSHLADTGNLSGGYSFSRNIAIGSGTWQNDKELLPPAGQPGALWPRVAIAGDYMVVVSNYTDSSAATPTYVRKGGVRSPMVYSRYKFSTATWVTQNELLPQYDSTLYEYGSSDAYSIDAKDNVVAIVTGRSFSDFALWKSTDYGATWTKTVMLKFPMPKYDFKSDTLTRTVCAGEAVHVVIDDLGMAHAFAERTDVSVDTATLRSNNTKNERSYTYWYTKKAGTGSSSDAILYWNETMAPDSVKIIATSMPTAGDSTLNFSTGNPLWYGTTNSSWPTVSIDATGNMYLVYSAFTVGDFLSEGNFYRDILVCASTDHGTTWSNPVNVTSMLGFNVEEIYPSVAKNADDNIHITYMRKDAPGNDQSTSSPENYYINHLQVSTAQIMSGTVTGVNKVKNEVFTINQNFPNPFNGATTIPVNLKKSTDISVSIVNVVGQTVYAHNFAKSPAGINNLQIDFSNLNSGIYFYTVEAEGYKVTNRMVVE